MIIYFDENMPKYLADGFHILQQNEGLRTQTTIEVRALVEDFGFGTKDRDWLTALKKANSCVITQDINIHRRKAELEIYRENKIGMFFLKGINRKRGLSVWQMVQALAKNWEEITRIATNECRPFAYEFSIKGKMKEL